MINSHNIHIYPNIMETIRKTGEFDVNNITALSKLNVYYIK